jgi:hypothetical protein
LNEVFLNKLLISVTLPVNTLKAESSKVYSLVSGHVIENVSSPDQDTLPAAAIIALSTMSSPLHQVQEPIVPTVAP